MEWVADLEPVPTLLPLPNPPAHRPEFPSRFTHSLNSVCLVGVDWRQFLSPSTLPLTDKGRWPLAWLYSSPLGEYRITPAPPSGSGGDSVGNFTCRPPPTSLSQSQAHSPPLR